MADDRSQMINALEKMGMNMMCVMENLHKPYHQLKNNYDIFRLKDNRMKEYFNSCKFKTTCKGHMDCFKCSLRPDSKGTN